MLFKKKEENLIDMEIKRRDQERELEKLQERSEVYAKAREQTQKKQELRNQIEADKKVLRDEKYRKYKKVGRAFGKHAGKVGKGFLDLAKHTGKNVQSPEFSNFMGAPAQPKKRPRKRKKNKRR